MTVTPPAHAATGLAATTENTLEKEQADIKEMTIGYDAKSIVGDVAGIGNYARTLVNDIER